ncbi:uncharacterized protein LOC123964106 isoform X2 [Micropterus dolomieu]|nr:uncharacterized protein LOC123964106 isoform X2 [Micropterus dolomieu]
MVGLRLTTVTLVFLLSVGGLAAVDQNKLAELIQRIKEEYPINNTMFSLAVSIKSEDPANLELILKKSPQKSVQKAISEGDVYKGKRLAVATVKKPEHAEWRVLKDLNLKGDKGDLLVIYSYASSCPTTCTKKRSNYNIIDKIKNEISKNKEIWSNYVFVFEKVFMPKDSEGIDEETLKKALKDLATSGIPLANIFRCYKPLKDGFQCISCSTRGEVTKQCVDYKA